MSADAARAFLPALRTLERELEAPILDRLRFLRELEYDLEALEGQLISEGTAPAEARARAIEALVPDRATLSALDRLHAPLYRRLTRGIREERLLLVERSALVAMTLAMLLGQTLLLFRARLLVDASPYLWVVLALGGVLFGTAATEIFEVWIKRDHRVPGRRRRAILGLSAGLLLAGIAATALDLYHLAAILERAPELGDTLVMTWIVRDCAVLFVTIILALAGGLVWLVLTQWLALVSEARRRALGLLPPTRTHGGKHRE